MSPESQKSKPENPAEEIRSEIDESLPKPKLRKIGFTEKISSKKPDSTVGGLTDSQKFRTREMIRGMMAETGIDPFASAESTPPAEPAQQTMILAAEELAVNQKPAQPKPNAESTAILKPEELAINQTKLTDSELQTAEIWLSGYHALTSNNPDYNRLFTRKLALYIREHGDEILQQGKTNEITNFLHDNFSEMFTEAWRKELN